MSSTTRSVTFDFRPLREADLPMLLEWHRRPHVARWWDPPESEAQLRAEYLTRAPGLQGFIAWLDGRPVGFVQVYVVRGAGDGWWPSETDPGARGIDQFLADERNLGVGLGSAMGRALLERLFADPVVSRVQTDPAPDNARAVRAYEKAGFTRVGVADTPDGPAVLMVCNRGDLELEDRGDALARDGSTGA